MSIQLTAIVLAAGRSQRMGCNKSFLPLGGKTVLQQVLLTLRAAHPAKILVVLGAQGEPVAESLADFAVTIVRNPAPDSDMADSLRMALAGLSQEDQGVMICLGDQPLIAQATYRRLADHYQSHPDAIVQPCCNGRKGHPVLLPSALLGELTNFATLRDLLREHAARRQLIDVDDPGILVDLDTPEDYQRALRLWAKSR